MKVIRFLRRHGPYQERETAGKPDTVADELVDAGIAEYAEPRVETKVEPPPEVTKVDPPAASAPEGQPPPLPKGNRRPATEKP